MVGLSHSKNELDSPVFHIFGLRRNTMGGDEGRKQQQLTGLNVVDHIFERSLNLRANPPTRPGGTGMARVG